MKTVFAAWIIGLAGLTCVSAYADPVTQTIDLGTVYTGNTPDGTAPWLEAQFAYTPDTKGEFTTGTLTLKSLFAAGDPDSVQGGGAATVGWAFFLEPENLIRLTCAPGEQDCANEAVFGATYKANAGPVPGVFNLSFRWNSDTAFEAGDSVSYELLFGSALTSSPFVENADGWSSAAHIEDIGAGRCDSWIVAGTGSPQGGGSCDIAAPLPVPEPPILGLFVLGLAGLALSAKRAGK